MHNDLLSIARSIFEALGIGIEDLSLVEEEPHHFLLTLRTPDSKILIGIHGKTLASFTHIFTRIFEKHQKMNVRVRLEINDYLANKEQKLYSWVDSVILNVKKSQAPIPMKNLSSYERKLVHHYIQQKNDSDLSTWSDDSEEGRILYVDSKSSDKFDLKEDELGI